MMYSDIDAVFIPHPITKDITRKLDDEAIKQSLRNLILTQNYERPFNPNLGCQIYHLLFEPASPLVLNIAEKLIDNTIQSFEPRISLNKVVASYTSNDALNISLTYTILNTLKPVQFDILVQRTR